MQKEKNEEMIKKDRRMWETEKLLSGHYGDQTIFILKLKQLNDFVIYFSYYLITRHRADY